jgi:hypothetical protein
MNWVKRFFISIAILAAVCLGGFIVYNIAYAVGEAAGYKTGHSVGHEAGYSLGKQDGYNTGYTSGKTEGYNTGYNSGKADGYDEGVQAGLGHGYTLKDPTYKEAVSFIEQDRTNGNKYVEDTYVCSHFARDVCNNAEQKGLRCAYVDIRYPDGGHTIVAFNTVDEGLVYFETQTDLRARPIVGKRYYQCQEPPPGYSYYLPPSYDDTIMDILVIW